MKYTGWFIYNGSLKLKKMDRLIQWMIKVGKQNDMKITPIKNNHIVTGVRNDELFLEPVDETIQHPEFVLFWDKDILLAKHLEKMGVKVYNSSESIYNCDHKSMTYQLLSQHKIKMPKTYFSPFVFSNRGIQDLSFLEAVHRQEKYPLVLKEAFGSFGQQVYLIENYEMLVKKVQEILPRPFVIQEYIYESFGKDLRINVVGDRVVGCMLRESTTDFRSNITLGGRGKKYTPTDEQQKLAVRATKALGLDFSGVDLLFGKNNEPIVCEVNSNPQLMSIYDYAGKNVLEDIFGYIKKDL